MLIHDESKKKLDELAQRFFWMNHKLDRMKAVLNVKFAMPNLAKRVHIELAHAYPLLADEVNDIEEMFNYDPCYLPIENASENYESVDEVINQLYEWTLETNDILCDTAKFVKECGDFTAYKLMSHIIIEHAKFVANAILLVDKKDLYKDRLYAMDDNVEEWWVL